MTNDAGKSVFSDRTVQNYDIRRPQQVLSWADSKKPEGEKNERPQEKQVTIFGLKMSYSRAFGIAFLVLFVLLFFPGFGVSSSGAKVRKESEQAK